MKKFLAAALLLAGSAGFAQQESLTLDWAFSDERRSVTSIPSRTWLNDGRALIYDERPAKSERTLQFLNADNGRRRAALDSEVVLEILNERFEPEDPYDELGWPDAIDSDGDWVAYIKSGDIVLVQLPSSNVVFVTESEAEESALHFAPDGSALAFVRDNDLFVWNIEAKEERRLTSDGSDVILNGTVSWVYWEELLGRSDRGYYWSPDSKSIAFLQTDEARVGQMHYVDFKPQLPKVIKQRHPKPGTANPKVRAGVIDVETAKNTWIDLGAYPYEYLARIKWLPDSKRLALQTLDRPQQKLDLFFADVVTGEVSHVLRERSDSWLNVHDDLHFLRDGRFVWVSEHTGYAHAYLYDGTGKRLSHVTAGEWSLRPSGGRDGFDQSIAYIDEDEGWMYFTSQQKSSIERHLYRIRLDGSDMMRLTEEDGTHRILFNPNGESYFDAWSSIDTPASLRLNGARGNFIDTIVDAPDLQGRFTLSAWELFDIELDDGFRMPAAMLRPSSFDENKQYPVVMYVYGGPAAPTVYNAWGGGGRGYYHQLLADKGFIVVYVDNRSAAAIGQEYTSQILHDAWGELELAELTSAVRWLKSRPYVDAERVGIWGWSGGGTHTLQAMTSTGEFYAGVSVAPVSDWDYYDTIYAERYMKRPQDNPDGYASTSHVDRAGQLQGRLMLIHGTYDDNVHPQNTWAFANELIEEGIMFEMMIYPMRKHGISDDAAQRHIYETMLEFWERSLH